MTPKSILAATLTASVAAIGPGGAAHADPPTQVTYQLTGSAPFADYVSYQTDSGVAGQVQQTHVSLPWKGQFTFAGNPVAVISAQSPGSITCSILVNGKVVNQATANGAPARTVCTT
jgi:hypothetical protein